MVWATFAMAPSFTSAAPQQRVIALAPNLVEMIYALGADQQLIGVVEHSNYPADAKHKAIVGNYARLNVEQIMALRPDLVIAWQGGSPKPDVDRLEQLGVKVVWSQIQTFDDVSVTLRQLGQLLHVSDTAEKLAGEYTDKLLAVRSQYGNKQPISVFYELWPQPLTTVGEGSWPQQSLTLCGADNIFSQAMGQYPHVSLEHVIAANPQVIIQPKDSARGVALTDWQRWPTIPAVANQAIATPDSDQLHRMTPRALAEAEKLCRQLDAFRSRYQVTP